MRYNELPIWLQALLEILAYFLACILAAALVTLIYLSL